MSEPSSQVYHGQTVVNVIRIYFEATRPAFLSASVLPVLTALAYVWGKTGTLDSALSLTIIITIICIHSAANVLNDYFDSRNGTDAGNEQRVYPFSGGSRFIQNGILTEQQTLRFGTALMACGLLLGLLIIFISGPLIFAIGFTGALLAIIYSAPPCLACRGLGDITIATCFGLLPVMGTVYSLTGRIEINAVWTGLVIGCFVAAILWINSIPDIEADKKAGKHTWPSRLNRRIASWMHGAWFIAGFGLILITPLVDSGYWAFIAVIPASIAVVSVINGKFLPAIPMTITTHATVCILLGVGFIVS